MPEPGDHDSLRRAVRAYFGLGAPQTSRPRLPAAVAELIFGVGTGTVLLLHSVVGSGSTPEGVLGAALLGLTAWRLLGIARGR